MKDAASHYRAVAVGRRNKVAGELWERMIEASCCYYSDKGLAEIAKTPEPLRPIQSLGKGRFVAVFTKKAQPDYKGTLKGGRAVAFEAKHTDADRLEMKALTSEQKKRLDLHHALGADCFVLVSFRFERFFKVPWSVFRDMKANFGAQYITPEKLKGYEIKYVGGILRFL